MRALLNKKLLILAVILFFGFLLRVVFINNSPPSLYGDELTITLDAYSLLNTGRDQLGNLLPLTFPMGAGRPAGYVYGSVPFVAIFGPTALGVRALSIISGMGIIILLYLLGKRLFSERVGFLAAAVGAVSPWDISLSRGGFEAHFALFLALLGIYLFLLARQKPIFYVFSALSFGLTLHTYPTYKLSLLLFLPLLFWYQGGKGIVIESKKYLIGAILVLGVLGFASLSQTFFGGSETRFANINILSQGELKNSIEQKINLERQVTSLPSVVSKYFHNKPLEYTKVFIENYLQNFSLDFLVLHGDRNPRHNMATMGGIYLVEIVLIIIGLLYFWQRQKRTIVFLALWIALAPIPTAVVDLPHALRSSYMLPPLLILSALGLSLVIDKRNKLMLFLTLLFFIIQFVFFVQKLYFLAPNEYSNFWSYPAKLATEIAIENKNKFDYIILSSRIDNMEYAYPVYTKIYPDQIISQNNIKIGSYQFRKYGNVYIGNLPDDRVDSFLENLNSSALFIGLPFTNSYLNGYESIYGRDEQATLILKKISE